MKALVLAALVSLGSHEAAAETIALPNTKVKLVVPDGWKPVEAAGVIGARRSPKGTIVAVTRAQIPNLDFDGGGGARSGSGCAGGAALVATSPAPKPSVFTATTAIAIAATAVSAMIHLRRPDRTGGSTAGSCSLGTAVDDSEGPDGGSTALNADAGVLRRSAFSLSDVIVRAMCSPSDVPASCAWFHASTLSGNIDLK